MSSSNRSYKRFHIHGDNIVECERTIDLLLAAIQVSSQDVFQVLGPFDSAVCPRYHFKGKDLHNSYDFILFPGFGRWNENIQHLVRARGGVLREAADTIVTDVSSGQEIPVMAIEYCAALPAGNQAWQRSGRSYSFGKAAIPYIYIAEIGGFELGENRRKKNVRMPNSIVPFSFISFSFSSNSPCILVYLPSPGAPISHLMTNSLAFGKDELSEVVGSLMTGSDPLGVLERVRGRMIRYMQTKSPEKIKKAEFGADDWKKLVSVAESGANVSKFLVEEKPLVWKKTVSIKSLTDTARAFIDECSKIGIGVTCSRLPLCIISGSERPKLSEVAKKIYGESVSAEFYKWLGSANENLCICWVLGFKPRGDDARPDRGLGPLARMILGEKHEIMSFIYGPAASAAYEHLQNDPSKLLANGLWESIFVTNSALLVDSANYNGNNRGYLCQHWQSRHDCISSKPFKPVLPVPTFFGENDVDTAVHLLFAKILKKDVFECSCNPPGGDWSGISLQCDERKIESRWLTLPRVSGDHRKRPDHVVQIFWQKKKIIFIIESKSTIGALEENIGPRLKAFLRSLTQIPPSVVRDQPNMLWRSPDGGFKMDDFLIVTGAAFLSQDSSNPPRNLGVDILMEISLSAKDGKCSIILSSENEDGNTVAEFLLNSDLSETPFTIFDKKEAN